MADDELEALRERRREELRAQLSGPATPSASVEVEDSNHFHELIDRHQVVLVDFYADWCGPCQMLEPVLDDIAAETDAAVVSVDIDVHSGLAGQHDVRGVPTLVLYVDGTPADELVGLQDRATLESLVRRHLE